MVIDHFFLSENDWVPNNPHLPVIVCHGIAAAEGDLATTFEKTFARNGWQGIWRNGIFDYHHYHTMAHEVLGIARGQGVVMLGGPASREVKLAAGDCLILPAGTGHCRCRPATISSSLGAIRPDRTPTFGGTRRAKRGSTSLLHCRFRRAIRLEAKPSLRSGAAMTDIGRQPFQRR